MNFYKHEIENNVHFNQLNDLQKEMVKESINVFLKSFLNNGFFNINKALTQNSVENSILTELCIRQMGGKIK